MITGGGTTVLEGEVLEIRDIGRLFSALITSIRVLNLRGVESLEFLIAIA